MTGRPRVPAGHLSQHELRVVTELARGGGHRQIGIRLGMTTTAVSTTLHRAARRLDAQGPAHLVARAIGLRLIPAGIALTPEDTPGGAW